MQRCYCLFAWKGTLVTHNKTFLREFIVGWLTVSQIHPKRIANATDGCGFAVDGFINDVVFLKNPGISLATRWWDRGTRSKVLDTGYSCDSCDSSSNILLWNYPLLIHYYAVARIRKASLTCINRNQKGKSNKCLCIFNHRAKYCASEFYETKFSRGRFSPKPCTNTRQTHR